MNIQNSPESRSQRKTENSARDLRFAFEHALKRHPTLSAKARRYGVVLSIYMDNKTGVARPGRRTLKRDWGFTTVATKYAQELVEAHLIRIESKGNGTVNYYRSLCTWGENSSVILGDGTELKSPRYESEESENRTRIGHGSDDDDRAQMRHAPNPNQAHPVPESGTNHSSSSPLMRKHEGGGGTRPKAGASPKGSAPAPDTNSTPASPEDLRTFRAWLEEHLRPSLPKSARVDLGNSALARIVAARLSAGWKPDRLAQRVMDRGTSGVKSWAGVLRTRLEDLPETPDEVERLEEERLTARRRMTEEFSSLYEAFSFVREVVDPLPHGLTNERMEEYLDLARGTAWDQVKGILRGFSKALGEKKSYEFTTSHDLVLGATRDENRILIMSDLHRYLGLLRTAEKCLPRVKSGGTCEHYL